MKSNLLVLSLSAGVLAGCGGGGSGGGGALTSDDAPPVVTSSFEVTVTNLTNAQPLSPIAFVTHDGAFRVFALGQPASAGLEVMAEGGDNTDLLEEAASAAGVFETRSTQGPVGPGSSVTETFTVNEDTRTQLSLSVSSMLVNTNDAFSALNSLLLSDLEVGDTLSLRTIAYDAGTEADSEGPGTIPGPADGGEGFNAVSDDEADRVSMHPGTVTNAAGLASSVLTDQHRFDNPVMAISITRVN